METTRWEYWKDNFKQGRVSAWEWMGINGLIFGILVALIAGIIVSRTTSERLQLLVFFSVSILVTLIIYVPIVLYFAIFTIPSNKYKEQTNETRKHQSFTENKAIINTLVDLRKKGVKLRNQGETLMHHDRVEPWWKEHLEWREKTENTIGLLDKNIAAKWAVLDTFTPKRPFSKAISPDHRKKLQMFDAWLERLDEVITELRGGEN